MRKMKVSRVGIEAERALGDSQGDLGENIGGLGEGEGEKQVDLRYILDVESTGLGNQMWAVRVNNNLSISF